jgi:hypothetical protein
VDCTDELQILSATYQSMRRKFFFVCACVCACVCVCMYMWVGVFVWSVDAVSFVSIRVTVRLFWLSFVEFRSFDDLFV